MGQHMYMECARPEFRCMLQIRDELCALALLFLSLIRYETATFMCMLLCRLIVSTSYICKNAIQSVPR